MGEHTIVAEGTPRTTCRQSWCGARIDGRPGTLTQYREGAIQSVAAVFQQGHAGCGSADFAYFIVTFFHGETYEWQEKYFDVYGNQFGISVSMDGKLVFVQTHERGLRAYDSRTGALRWKTKSRHGITNIYVNDKTVLCHQRERALQLLDIQTGAVLKEKRPATAWGFTVLARGYIICHTRSSKWEIIRTEDLETVETISNSCFPECVVRDLWLNADRSKLCYYGFRNVWDNSATPAARLPNEEFEGEIEIRGLSFS